MKNYKLIMLFIVSITVPVMAQKATPEERFSSLKTNYTIVSDKFNNGTLTLEEPEYKECRRLISKINSYDAATTKKNPEFIEITKKLDEIKEQAQMGTVYLSSSADGSKKQTSFEGGSPMFVIIKCGMTLAKESLRPHPEDKSKKVLTVYFETAEKAISGIAEITIPEDKWNEKTLSVELTLDGKNPDLKNIELAMGKLKKGTHAVNMILPRGEFASSINKNMPRVEIPFQLSITNDKLAKQAEANNKSAYESITLGKAVRTDKNLENEFKTLFEKQNPNANVQRVVINEDWYDLTENGYLTYKKINCYLAVKKGSDCYRVYVGFVKENLVKDGTVKLGPLKILETGAGLKYTPMPCANITK